MSRRVIITGAAGGLGKQATEKLRRQGATVVGLDLKAIVDAFENHLIDQALARTSNNKNRASELLKMNRTTLVEKLRKRGMIVPATKKRGPEMGMDGFAG